LDKRYIAGEGAPFAHVLGYLREWKNAYNAREWDVLRGLLADDFVAVDHRPASFGRLDSPDALIGYFREFVDLVPDIRWYFPEIHRVGDRCVLVSIELHGTSTDGTAIENPSRAV